MTCPNCRLALSMPDVSDGQIITCPNCDFASEVYLGSMENLSTGAVLPVALLEPLAVPNNLHDDN